jgi:hypothetical protein
MNAKDKYLEDLNICFGQYLKTNSLPSYKRFDALIRLGERKYNFLILEYFGDHYNYNANDFDKIYSKEVSQIKKVFKNYLKVVRSFEDAELANELYYLYRKLYNELMEKCQHKFKNGKYVLLKQNGKIYIQFGNMISDSYAQLQKTKKNANQKIRGDKFAEIRLLVKQLKEKDLDPRGIQFQTPT